MSRSQNTKTGFFWGFIIFFGIGVLVLYSWIMAITNAISSKSWPSATGTVTLSRVQTERDYNSEKNKTSYTYSAELKYSFQVEGTEYVGNQISFGDYSSSNRKKAYKKIKHYPSGKSVKVYFNPEDPTICVLERRAGFGSLISLLVGFLFTISGLGMLIALILKFIRGE